MPLPADRRAAMLVALTDRGRRSDPEWVLRRVKIHTTWSVS